MAATILLLLGAVYAISTVVVFGAFFAALREEKMARGTDELASGQEVGDAGSTSKLSPGAADVSPGHDVKAPAPSPPLAKFIHRMEREAISRPPIDALDDSWAANKLLGRITMERDELEDIRK